MAVKSINLNKHILEDVVKIFQPATVLSWHRDLVGKKYDSSGSRGLAKRGPKMVPPEVIAEVLKLARRNRDKATNASLAAWSISDLKSQNRPLKEF